jgi:hypothetical protein
MGWMEWIQFLGIRKQEACGNLALEALSRTFGFCQTGTPSSPELVGAVVAGSLVWLQRKGVREMDVSLAWSTICRARLLSKAMVG